MTHSAEKDAGPTYHPAVGAGLFDADDEVRDRLWWCGPCQDYHEGTCPIPPGRQDSRKVDDDSHYSDDPGT